MMHRDRLPRERWRKRMHPPPGWNRMSSKPRSRSTGGVGSFGCWDEAEVAVPDARHFYYWDFGRSMSMPPMATPPGRGSSWAGRFPGSPPRSWSTHYPARCRIRLSGGPWRSSPTRASDADGRRHREHLSAARGLLNGMGFIGIHATGQ